MHVTFTRQHRVYYAKQVHQSEKDKAVLKLMDAEIMTWVKIRYLTHWATQMPPRHQGFLKLIFQLVNPLHIMEKNITLSIFLISLLLILGVFLPESICILLESCCFICQPTCYIMHSAKCNKKRENHKTSRCFCYFKLFAKERMKKMNADDYSFGLIILCVHAVVVSH